MGLHSALPSRKGGRRTRVGRRPHLDLPNVMIKVPGTAAGLPAIEELTRLGMTINVTLLFSRALRGGDRRLPPRTRGRRGRDDRLEPVTSAASFLLSRIDTTVDGRPGD